MTLPSRSVLAIGIAIAISPTDGASQGVAPLHLGGRFLEPAPSTLFRSRLGVLSLGAPMRVTASLPTCAMPVVVPDLSRSERMPGSHAPGPASVGPERFGCTNPLGPQSANTGASAPARP